MNSSAWITGGLERATRWLLACCVSYPGLGCAARAPAPAVAANGAAAESPVAAQCSALDTSELRFGLIVLGSGAGPRALGRAGASQVVVINGTPRVLIDAGPGTFLRLGQTELDLRALDIVLLTHLHLDHAGGLPGFVNARSVTSSGEPLTFRITGPAGAGLYPGAKDLVERLFGAGGAFAYLPTQGQTPLRFDVSELPEAPDVRTVLEEDGLRVRAITVDHGNVPALAYRIEHAGRALVITGDLVSANDDIVQLASGVDLLVYDTAVLDPPGSSSALYDLHTPPRRIGEVAALAQVKSLLLNHITGRVADHASDVLQSVQAGYRGQTRFAHDCLAIELAPH